MKTYEVTQSVEMMVTWKVRAKNADEANEVASARTHNLCHSLGRARKNIAFGDITDDYLPARDE
jgi:hypothetical protein